MGVDRPTSLISSPSDTSQRFLALFRREGFNFINNYHIQELVKSYSFPTVAATQNYALPSDLAYLKNITGWNNSKRFLLNGPLTPREWTQVTQYGTFSSYTYFYRIQNKTISLYPIPSAVDTISFEYQSNEWVVDSVGVRQSDILDDTDEPYVDNEILALGLKWRYLKSVGLPYDEDYNEYKNYLNERFSKQFTARELYTDNFSSPFAVVIPETIPYP